MTSKLTWRKSSHSGAQGNCVEVTDLPGGGGCAVRDTKNAGGAVLRFTSSQWREFIDRTRKC
jgi:hypothetical protein